MKIITVPHPHLRQMAQPIETVTPETKQLVDGLGQTLIHQTKPRGVGLAAPQVDRLWRMFATYLSSNGDRDDGQPILRIFINPVIEDHSSEVSLGPDPESPVLEGCLSIPTLYGPVPRWPKMKLSFEELVEDELLKRTETFTDFAARVIQHELDHLNGVLFTDYSLDYDLPVFQENRKTRKMEEIDKRILEAF